MEERFIVLPIEWNEENELFIQEVYRLFKDQEKKIFDLSWYEDNEGGILEYIQEAIVRDYTYVVFDRDKQKVAGVFILEGLRVYKDKVLYANAHCVISKKYWGRASREVCKVFVDYLKERGDVDKLIATIPQNNYSLIKLLKAIGFTHEGTVKKTVVYLDKNGNEKKYDELIYGLDLEGDK